MDLYNLDDVPRKLTNFKKTNRKNKMVEVTLEGDTESTTLIIKKSLKKGETAYFNTDFLHEWQFTVTKPCTVGVKEIEC